MGYARFTTSNTKIHHLPQDNGKDNPNIRIQDRLTRCTLGNRHGSPIFQLPDKEGQPEADQARDENPTIRHHVSKRHHGVGCLVRVCVCPSIGAVGPPNHRLKCHTTRYSSRSRGDEPNGERGTRHHPGTKERKEDGKCRNRRSNKKPHWFAITFAPGFLFFFFWVVF